jgi:hypothetical protein
MSDFTDAIKRGDKRKQLEALREKLATEIDACFKGADVAALTLRLMKVLEELESIPETGKASSYDELKAARDARTGGTPNAARRQGGRRRRGTGT